MQNTYLASSKSDILIAFILISAQMIKKISILAVALFITVASFAQDSKNVAISKSVIGHFQKNEYPEIVLSFDATMKKVLPADILKVVWEDLNKKYGTFQKYSTITTDKIQGYDVVYTLCHFQKINFKMKLVFNDKNEIAGLFFIPEDQK